MRSLLVAAVLSSLLGACGTDDGSAPPDASGGSGFGTTGGSATGGAGSGGLGSGGLGSGGVSGGSVSGGASATGAIGGAMGGVTSGGVGGSSGGSETGGATGGAALGATGGAETGGAETGGATGGTVTTGGSGGATGGSGGSGGTTGGSGGASGGSGGASGGSGGDCTDSNVNCRWWADNGECENNPGYMLASCCASCRDTGSGGTGGGATVCSTEVLDCGSAGVILEDAGPPMNRVNYVIVGDCYTASELDTTFLEHVRTALAYRFGPIGEPYARYRKFVNVCALKTPSNVSGCSTSARDTAFGCWGSDSTRLGLCDTQAAYDEIQRLLPASVEVTWTAIVMNDSAWWNSGGQMMIWSGGHGDGPTAALHEGGHGFHGLADEYTGGESCAGAAEPREINVTRDPTGTANKWSAWLGFDQTGLTGLQSTYEGARYCNSDMWRPSTNSMMNMCFASFEPTNAYNSISREKMVRDIYAAVRPIDCFAPAETTLSSPQTLSVTVVDPAVIKLDWSVDGSVVTVNGGATFDVAARQLSSGQHTVTARAYDDTELVRGDRSALEQSVTWTVSVP